MPYHTTAQQGHERAPLIARGVLMALAALFVFLAGMTADVAWLVSAVICVLLALHVRPYDPRSAEGDRTDALTSHPDATEVARACEGAPPSDDTSTEETVGTDVPGSSLPHDESPTPEGPEGAAPSPSTRRTPACSQFDLADLENRLEGSSDPIAELKLLVGDIRTRQASRGEGGILLPSGLEDFAARMLEEAGLFSTDVDLPAFQVVVPRRSGMFYLRWNGSIAYLARLRLIRIEAALNAARSCALYFADEEPPDEDDCFQLCQSFLSSICAQVPSIHILDEPPEGDLPDTEWTVRHLFSRAVESLKLPYRLEVDYRVNVADGNMAIQIGLPGEQVFPSSMYVQDLGVVTSSREMRRKAASSYALRLALLLATCAFRTSRKIRHVWIAGIMDTPKRHWCCYSIDFDRWRFQALDLKRMGGGELERALHRFVPQMRYENGMLKPVGQAFQPSEPRFCPPWRHESVSLSARRIAPEQSRALGCDHVYDLAIEEADKRALVATTIMRRLVSSDVRDSTEQNVRMILDVAGDDPDPTVRDAAERTVRGLIDGSLKEDVFAVGEEFVRGDVLSRAAGSAQRLLQEHRAAQARLTLMRALATVDERGVYRDSAGVQWRYFGNYVDRALYNRLYAQPGTSVMLVPDSYFECVFMLSVACLSEGDAAGALVAARRCLELAPLDRRVRLHLVRCLESSGDNDAARQELGELLKMAHDPEGVGIGYYRMAYFQWRSGNILAAEACYMCAISVLKGTFPMAAMELSMLASHHPDTYHENMSLDEVAQVLRDANIPVAPTEQMSSTFMECTKASLDAEVFPVARNFISILSALYPDDVIFSILRSLEDEPDA